MNTLTDTDVCDQTEAYLPLVRATARATHTSLEYEDRCQEGYLGLKHAIERFDEAVSPAFARYARKCIRGYILRGTVQTCNQFGLPTDNYWIPGLTTQIPLDGLVDFQRDQLLGASPDPDPDLLELRRQLERAMETLSQRERLVLRLRCGWDGIEPKTFLQIGKILRRTAEAVRQIELKAIRKLRHRVSPELLDLLTAA